MKPSYTLENFRITDSKFGALFCINILSVFSNYRSWAVFDLHNYTLDVFQNTVVVLKVTFTDGASHWRPPSTE